jgi:uncharacterized membrane protein
VERNRVVGFTDAVIAIIITLMTLEIRVPDEIGLPALRAMAPEFLSYALSFTTVSIFWNNHHHFFQMVRRVDGLVLWANMHWLFWLSLTPFATGWMGRHNFAAVPTATYGFVLLMAALASNGLKWASIRAQGDDSLIARTMGRDLKANISPLLYFVAILCAFIDTRIAAALYLFVAMLWFVPDRRVERAINAPK